MKPTLCSLLILALLTPALPLQASDVRQDFERARALYDARDFRGAAAVYENLLTTRGPSVELFYNLGNAYFKFDEPGRAAVALERALLINPGHVEATENLARVRAALAAVELKPNWSARLLNRINPTLGVLIATACAWIALFAFVCAAWRRGQRWQFATIGLFTALVAVAWPILHSQASGLLADPSRAIVLHKDAEARHSPALGANKITALPPGSSVRVLMERGTWSYVAFDEKERGWIQTASLERPLVL